MPKGKSKSKQGLSLPFGERVTFLCLCKEKLTKRKHTLPTRPRRCASRVHSAAGIFRRDVPVSSKNDVHPCTSPLRGPVRRLRRCGRGPGGAKAGATATATATAEAEAEATPPQPSPALRAREGAGAEAEARAIPAFAGMTVSWCVGWLEDHLQNKTAPGFAGAVVCACAITAAATEERPVAACVITA